MKFADKQLECQDCGAQFTWDASEQAYFAKKGFKEVPRRCRACRAKKKIEKEAEMAKEKEITCVLCGKSSATTTEISPDEETICMDCFLKEQTKPLPVPTE